MRTRVEFGGTISVRVLGRVRVGGRAYNYSCVSPFEYLSAGRDDKLETRACYPHGRTAVEVNTKMVAVHAVHIAREGLGAGLGSVRVGARRSTRG